jgi:hypothetical protein
MNSTFHYLPKGILAHGLPVAELPKAAPPEWGSCLRGADQQPFGDSARAGDRVTIVVVVSVRDPLEPSGQPTAHLGPADASLTPRFGTPAEVEGAVIGEELQDRIHVVAVEGLEEYLQSLCGPWRRTIFRSEVTGDPDSTESPERRQGRVERVRRRAFAGRL